MSRLSRERVQIALSPHQVAMVRLASGWKNLRVTDRKRLSCAQAEAQPNWSTALAALHEMLSLANSVEAPTTVILSNHFVRYLVLPWSAELVTASDELHYARARFVQVFGDKARQWAIRTSDAPARAERLSAATDLALLDALARTLDASGLSLASCQPALMAQFNASRNRIGADAWLVCAEHGRVLVALVCNGRWRSVRARPLNGAAVPLRDLLAQERVLVSAGTPDNRIFVSVGDDVVIDTQGLRTESLGPPGVATPGTPADATYALAMTGLH